MKISRIWIIIGLLVFVPVVYLSFSGLYSRHTETPLPASRPAFDQEIIGLTFTDYAGGKKRLEIATDRFTIGPKRIGFFKTPFIKEAHMTNPRIRFFGDDGSIANVSADAATMNMGSKKISLKNNVRLVTHQGKELSSKRMELDPKKGVVSVAGSYVLHDGEQRIEGRQLKADIELKNCSITQGGEY